MDARILQLKAAIYSAKIVTDSPLYETPWDLFDEYLEDKPRVFNAMFPHKHSIQQLYEYRRFQLYHHLPTPSTIIEISDIETARNQFGIIWIEHIVQDEWRIKMMPLKVVALKVWQVIDFRLKCKYPLQVPSDITKLLEVQLTRCELQGLDKVIDSSSHFALGVKARLYPDRRGNKSRIRGDCEINIRLVFPPTFTFIPGGAIRDILVKGVMAEIGERIKVGADDSLLADYRNFRKERSDNRRNYFTKI
ncbi:uncharacterized protein LOC108471666 [Gossypium arboreum]|uniref:uncharacterized protein LOC108471666 n=1 Tax=Gossypium arboreum TaxID=29729 RepID=UPI0022F1B9C1|nr:uncharacterized protein LOC108471666 [Gossypium arboreum]